MRANKQPDYLLKHYMNKNGWIEVPSVGVSMYPLIREGNVCKFIRIDKEPLQRGDIVLFLTDSGHLIGHRLFKIVTTQQGLHYICKGDSNVNFDLPVRHEQIIGKLVHIRKKSYRITVDGWLPRFWGRLMLLYPALSRFLQRVLRARAKLARVKER